jgi:hypothetical protein
VKGDAYVGIDDALGMRSFWMMMCQMFEPLRPLDKSRRTGLAVEGLYVFVLFRKMIKHRILLLAHILGAMRANILTERILDVFCRHSWT